MRTFRSGRQSALMGLLALTVVMIPSCGSSRRVQSRAGGAIVAPWAWAVTDETVVAPVHLVNGIPSRTSEGAVNVVIEIPAGTTPKFEVNKNSGALEWEYRDGRPRVVDFLAYPANYGMVPSTLLPENDGGDGDPLDVVVLGPSFPRGAVVPARVVGAIRLLDDGEVDDKLIAVPVEVEWSTPFTGVGDLPELQSSYPSSLEILKLWFLGYKGPRVVEFTGWANSEEANNILRRAEADYVTHARH